MANEPKINLALVGEMPENPVRGTVYMSPDASGNFVKVGVDGSVRTIFDGSDYVRKDESVWIPGYGEKSAVLANDYSYATGDESVSHGSVTYARGTNSHAEGVGSTDYPISVRSDFRNNIIYGANNVSATIISFYIGLIVRYQDVYATIINAFFEKTRGAVFVLDKPLLDDGSDFMESTEVYLLSGGVAAGRYSHTEGHSTVAVGDRAHAEGFATYAGNTNSHAEGVETDTYGEGAHAEGCGTLATGPGSHVEGNATAASGNYSHAEGIGTRASGECSHAEGEGQEFLITIDGSAGATQYTISGDSLADIKEGDIIRYRGFQQKSLSLLPYEKRNPDNGFTYAIIREVHLGKNRYIVVDKTLSLLTAITNGPAYILQGVAEGISSHSEGYYTNTIGNYSHSEGTGTRALGDYSHVEGDSATASGASSHAEGFFAIASGEYSHAEGNSTTALGDNSHAEGYSTAASGDNSHAEGENTTASGHSSHAEGYIVTASGPNSHAEGYSTTAFGEISHAEGTRTMTFGGGSHAEGEGNRIPLDGVEVYGQQNTTVYTTSSAHELSVNDIIYVDYGTDEFANKVAKVVSVDTSTQFTVDNTLNPDVSLDASLAGTYVFYRLFGCTYGTHSHVEGVDTRTLGDYSHAEGNGTTALGDHSHAEGRYTRTSNEYEHAQGSYNMSHSYDTSFGNSGNTLNSIGVGVSDASRSNAIEVMQNGDVYVKGVGSYDGSNYVNASTLQEVVNSGGGGSTDSMISITYAELKNLRDTSALIPGMQYRITDYECTTTQTDTSVAGNVFDIIVTADSSTELNENARAAHHTGDTYFQICDLDAWELKYCLDNDTDRFAWADATNGKGIVYYMKDEWSNECPYDFKNILFTDNGDNYYTFDVLDDSVHCDFSVAQALTFCCYGNIIEENNNDTSGVALYKLTLGRNIFKNTSLSSICCSNTLKNGCYNNTFGNGCRNNTFGNYCRRNSFGNGCNDNTFGNECYMISFGNYCSYNAFGNGGQLCSFGNGCHNNTFGNGCYINSFGNNCQYITVFDNVIFCNVTGGSSASPVQNAQILNGTHGASSTNKLNIIFSRNKDYTQVAGLVDGTDLRIWIAEDTVTGPTSSADGNIAIFDGSSGKVVKDSGLKISDIGTMMETTWSTLKLLKENSGLVPGRMYRITDYNTTVSEDLTDVSVAGHQFDIIVTALSDTELDCRASAIQHVGNTYFSDCDLSKWQLWYDIENDTEKYAWAVGDSSSANSGAKGSVPAYAPEYIEGDKTMTTALRNAGHSHCLVFQGIETITINGTDVECYIYGTSVQAATFDCVKLFCQESPLTNGTIYSINSKGVINLSSTINFVSSSTQPTDGTKIIAKSVTSAIIAGILKKAGVSQELEFNGRIVMHKGQNCYSYGSDAQYAALANDFHTVSNIIVADGISPVTPKKASSDPGTNVVILDDGILDGITAISQETVVVGGTGGTGVIYRMIDEWGNDCPYDFKNILFKRWEVTECVKCPSLIINNSENPYGLYYGAKNFSGENIISDASYGSNSDWFYTFALKDISSGQWYDYSILNYLKLKNSESLTVSCQTNKISYNIEIDAGNIKQYLNNIVFFNCVTNLLDEAHPVSSDCTRNTFSNACHSSTFGINCYGNIFGNQNYGNTAGMDFASNKAEAYCTNNVFGNNIQCNSFDIYFALNSIKDNALGNSFGKYCYNNIIGSSFETNTLGMYCYNNTFGDSTYSNTFGNEYCDNTAGMHMVFNFFQNRCNNNTFGVYFESNTVGNGCAYSSFGNYLLSCTFFNYITYCNITGGTSTSAPVRYSQILDGTKGADQNNRLTISLAVNKNYQQTAGLNSSGVLKIWTPADLID